MKVKVLSKTENLLETIYVAARTCYNPGSPINMCEETYSREEMIKLIRACIRSGHQSVIEHANFTIAIEGVSRALTHQLVRHRLCSFSQQSQRYVEIKEDIQRLTELEARVKITEIENILNKYFLFDSADIMWACFSALKSYLNLINKGYNPEDARQVLPNCTKTNIVMTCNLRELLHICNERLCTRAQLEIRMLFKEIVKQVTEEELWLAEFLKPKCEMLGYCPEAHGACGRMPKKK